MDDPLPTSTLTTSEGHTVAWVEGGDPDGFPVIGLHGTPGCRWSRWPDDRVYADAGVRYVTIDRPGYGRTSRRRGRSVADGIHEVEVVARALDLREYAVVGGSGGGPHALACAALLPARESPGPDAAAHLVRVACQSSLAPVGTGGMTRRAWVEGMAPEAAAELAWAEEGEARVEAEQTRLQAEMAAALDADPADLFGDVATESDAAFLARPDLLDNWRRIVAEQAAQGVGGAVDDTLAFARPWGINLAAIRMPVLLTHGEQDLSCPIGHGRWLAARLPTATVEFDAEGGHLPRSPEAEFTATLRWLRGA